MKRSTFSKIVRKKFSNHFNNTGRWVLKMVAGVALLTTFTSCGPTSNRQSPLGTPRKIDTPFSPNNSESTTGRNPEFEPNLNGNSQQNSADMDSPLLEGTPESNNFKDVPLLESTPQIAANLPEFNGSSNPPPKNLEKGTSERIILPITMDDGATIVFDGALEIKNSSLSFNTLESEMTLKGQLSLKNKNSSSPKLFDLNEFVLKGEVLPTGTINLIPDSATQEKIPDHFVLVGRGSCYGASGDYDPKLKNCKNVQIKIVLIETKSQSKGYYSTSVRANLPSSQSSNEPSQIQESDQLDHQDSNNSKDTSKEQDQKIEGQKSRGSSSSPSPTPSPSPKNQNNHDPSTKSPESSFPTDLPLPSKDTSSEAGKSANKNGDPSANQDTPNLSHDDLDDLISKGVIPPNSKASDTSDIATDNAKSSSANNPKPPPPEDNDDSEEELDLGATVYDPPVPKSSLDYLEAQYNFVYKKNKSGAEAVQNSSVKPFDACKGDPICMAKKLGRPYNQSFHRPQNGFMRNSTSLVSLAKASTGKIPYMVLSPERGNYFGSYDLVKTVEALGQEIQKDIPGYKVMVRDMSKKSGGSFGHKSHTNGTDMDIAYIRKNGNRNPTFVTVCDSQKIIDANFDIPSQWKAFYFLANDRRVHLNVIYVAPAVRKAMCKYTQIMRKTLKGEELSKVTKTLKALRSYGRNNGREISGHRNHFHVRLLCSPYDAGSQCRNFDSPEVNIGCN